MFHAFQESLEAACAANLSRPAVVFEGQTLRYAELERESARVAGKLQAAGIGRGDIVAITLPRGLAIVAAMLGVLRAGAAMCVISAEYPAERIAFIEGDTAARAQIDAAWMQALPDPAAEFPAPAPEDPAIVVYTSGSTGNPKGVVNSQRALSLALAGDTLVRTREDVFLSVASFSFIAVVVDLLVPLSLGACVHVLSDEMRRDAACIERYIHEHGITTAFLPPQLARVVLPKVEDQLLSLIVGSDRVYGIHSERTRIFNCYGASETCGPMVAFELDRLYPDAAPIGKPYAGSQVYVLDDDLKPVPTGEEGEICISGQVATEYRNLPELTAARFVDNPFKTGEEDAILFRTSDIGKLDSLGNLHYIQRRDWMLKIRGYRVEPGEIEQTMMRLAPIEQAVVTGFENAAGIMSLYAVYTAKEAVAPETVLAAVRDVLPGYMLPAFLEQVERLPLNANGKVNRRAICPPDAARFAAAYEPPKNAREAEIAAAFARVFGLERVGALDDFNLLGGDSILAAKLQAELPGLSASEILAAGTPRALAAYAAEAPLTKAAPRTDWPLTFAERQMATEQGMDPESVTYNVNLAFRIEGALDLPRLERALEALMARHAILRSYYPLVAGEYTHRIAEAPEVPIRHIDCPEAEARENIQAWNTPFDLAAAPLLRANLMRHAEGLHTLHFCFHHIIIDAGCSETFFSELFALYEGATLPPLAVEYLDFAAWQAEHADLRAGEAAFKAIFADGAPENEMPTVATRPAVLPVAEIDLERTIESAALKAAAKRLGVTRYGVLLAALGIALGKYCGSEDVVIGTAMSGRTLSEQEGMMGMFVNTLPIRLKPRGDQRVVDYVQEVAKTVRLVKSHQTYPFERLVPMLAPDRNASRSPVFDVIFNYLPELPLPEVEGLRIERIPIKGQALQMDLMLEAMHEGDSVRLVLSYSRELYEDAVVEHFFEQLMETLARILADDPALLVLEAAALPAAQEREILVDFAGEKTEAPKETLVDLFRAQAKRTPEARAVVFRGESLSYRELDVITDRLAAHLAGAGIGRGSVVGILVRRGFLMPIGALGALKAGAAYQPLDPSYPSDRLEFMLEDAGAKIVLGDPELRDRIPGYQGAFLESGAVFALPEGPVPAGPALEDLFILLYTSGTTGKPKGVMLLHSNTLNFMRYYSRINDIKEGDQIPAYASFGFDAHMMDLYPTLINGATLHIIPEDMRLDLPGLREYFEENGITIAFMTTQLGRQFADTMEVKSLRALGVGGEALTPLPPPRFALHNLYGPTECTVASNCFRVDRLYDRVPIGRAVDNVALYVLDSRGQLAPVGVGGELCIAGRQVGKGYLNRPDLTAEKFVENPFSQEPDYARMYRTGDVVRFLPSGDIDFLGRRDFQVKIRGFRVELTEIEGRIRQYPGILDATVLAQEDAGGGKRVVSYIVADAPVDIQELNAFIEEELPAYMVPSATMQIERIPLTQNGKVDRRALPKITIQAEEVVPPRTEMEAAVVSVAQEILKIEEIGATTDLLYAGLNSLSSIKAAAIITERTGKKLTTAELMRERTPARIAALLEGNASYEARTFEQRASYPLTSNQLGLYFACVKDPASLVYNIPIALSLGATEPEKLRACVEKVIEAHAYIKTHFALEGGEPVQLRCDDAKIEIPIFHCSEAEYASRKAAFVRPFSFFEGPLYRIEIIATPEGTQLLADFHHIVFDGGSMDLFLRDLAAAYRGEAIEQERFTSFDMALLEAERMQGEAYEAAKAFYHARLSDGEGATQLPTEREAEGVPRTIKAGVEKNKVEAIIKGLNVTPSNLFLAATALATGRFASTHSVRIATITNGREGVEVQNNLGMLVKTLPLAIDIAPAQSAAEYLKTVQAEMTDTLAHIAYPYMQAASEHRFSAELLYAYQGGVVSEHRLDDVPLRPEILGLDCAKFPISVNIQEDGPRFVVEVEYDDGKFDGNTMAAFAEGIAALAEKLVSAEGPIGALSILTEAGKATLASFHRPLEPIRTRSLPALFEAGVEAHPEDMALIAADASYTYRALNARANALAHALLARGVAREDRIAFMLPRDSRILVAMLGIMKAGCCYIPVDPEYPDERIAHVLEDSGARLILTDGKRSVPGGVAIDALLAVGGAETNPGLPIKGDDLAYIIYTSGSTGKPKGVMLTHRGIVNYVLDTPENRHVRALVENRCSMASVTTVSFDMFLKEAFTTLMNGLSLVLADDEEAKNPDRLAELILRTGANAFNATPSRMLQYMQLPAMQRALAQCKVILAGGEAYPPALYRKLREITDAVLINTYGPTEITVSSNGKLLESERITIGAPLYNVLELVMDIDGNPLPVGMTGELWIGGLGVARGYFGNPTMTAERFIEKYGVRWYRSGDLARFTEEGEVLILGRNDGQIKLRGLRIELGEIENSINAIEEITASVVLVQKINGVDHLSAYYSAKRLLPAEELREKLLGSLTKYMVPTAYLQMEALPMTPNGKIDRRALPEAKLMQRDAYEPPANEAEAAYCAMFEKALSLEKVGALDNFFDLGGTSLLVTGLTISATEQGFRLSYGDVFANPTPRALAALGAAAPAEEGPDEVREYDYTALHALLEENTLEALRAGEARPLGNLCISGATGFLGIHVLREYLEMERGTAYCIVRGSRLPAEKRLKNMLMYYFSDAFDALFGNRIVVVDGDITSPALFEKLMGYPIDTYINCAANVKHFSRGTDIEDINVGGVANGLAFAKEKGCRFVQISTASIAGMSIDGTPAESTKLTERMLYFGQDLSNKYARSKFLAERLVLEAAKEGLDAKIMRVGNLMARESDGEFQVNFKTNNFLGRLKAYHIVGCIPYEAMGASCEFAPIDSTARAVLLLAKTPAACRVFHPYNDHDIFMGDVVKMLAETGVAIAPAEKEAYDEASRAAFLDPEKARHLNALIAYQEYGKRVVPIKAENAYTAQALMRQGFLWPITTPQYLKNFFDMMSGLGFFERFSVEASAEAGEEK